MKSAQAVESSIDSLESDIKILEGLLKKKKCPTMKWEINPIESLWWDSSFEKIAFQYGDKYMILQFVDSALKSHVEKYMDEFFDRIKKQIGNLYE